MLLTSRHGFNSGPLGSTRRPGFGLVGRPSTAHDDDDAPPAFVGGGPALAAPDLTMDSLDNRLQLINGCALNIASNAAIIDMVLLE